jgi:hypothetical protein
MAAVIVYRLVKKYLIVVMKKVPGFLIGGRCRANTAHIRQSRPDSGLDFQVKVLQPLVGKVLKTLGRILGGLDGTTINHKGDEAIQYGPAQIQSGP